MLGLKLRREFTARRLEGTAIELANDRKTGALQRPAQDFLEITWPSQDLVATLGALGGESGRPVVLIGERGRGKSHLLAATVHVLREPTVAAPWLKHWGDRLNRPELGRLRIPSGMHVIAESLHRHRFKHLWDLVFASHPRGEYARGAWSAKGKSKTAVPPAEIFEELFEHNPTAIVLDEFQTWFEALVQTDAEPHKSWAFNFIQVLSEIARENPQRLALIVSVRNGKSEAYRQIHRIDPLRVDFKGQGADQDRRLLLLHRLFENRSNIAEQDIRRLLEAHVDTFFRLFEVPTAEHDRHWHDFVQCWPFSPQLMRLLEDQILVATDAQETRDLIRILAGLYKVHGEKRPLLTAGDFRLDEDAAEVGALLDSVASDATRSLREKARRNLVAVKEASAGPAGNVPHAEQLLGALWIRSLAAGNVPGAERRTLQLDVTGERPLDANAFALEINHVVENSFNIHQDGERLVFRQEENPQAKLMAHAKNPKNFADGSDIQRLAAEARYVLCGSGDLNRRFRFVVLGPNWEATPWEGVPSTDLPEAWDDRLTYIVIPEGDERVDAKLGAWLQRHVPRFRNALRFLLPRADAKLYFDSDLTLLARAALTASRWGAEYARLEKRYRDELGRKLGDFWDRFALLDVWSNDRPEESRFHVVPLKVAGPKIADAVEAHLGTHLFVTEDFEELALAHSRAAGSLHQLLDDVREPRPNGQHCIPWLGETAIKEHVLRLCAAGRLAIDNRGTETLQRGVGESEEATWQRIKGHLPTGSQLRQTILLPIQPMPASATAGPQARPHTVEAEPTILLLQPEGLPPPTLDPRSLNIPFEPAPPPPAGPLTRSRTVSAGTKKTLISSVEGAGIGPATKLRTVVLSAEGLTGAQLSRLLITLPEALSFALELEREGE